MKSSRFNGTGMGIGDYTQHTHPLSMCHTVFWQRNQGCQIIFQGEAKLVPRDGQIKICKRPKIEQLETKNPNEIFGGQICRSSEGQTDNPERNVG